MQFLDLERYLFPDDLCNFTRFHGVAVDGKHNASVDPEDDAWDAGESIEEERVETPPAPTVDIQPKRVRFAIDEEPAATTIEEKPIVRKKKRNMRQFIIQKSIETQNHRDDRSSSSSTAHTPSSPKSRRVPSSPFSTRTSKSSRRRRKFHFVSALFA
uniref:Uncharacterized protein n=1 Tax=Pseudo-nitzschia australis TaxID=44445 RepID=A0A7S4A9H6_9STRA|mmetsp:Transcript_173/g.434  ORF Transcript_173/g.434 Transcript_173/m.434 type:complete len:157 (+) Transcript_173:128-598(+)|eukprot:CAMPEP_0168193202 /NCGR_PEP_ID=MMETSP0139_2-20121125/18469_1 /TAXON_ID=44445 /ORGANISM="Pseudo-nitzschia australis, Strain 10249 10 AB" /LENGTH=156 /DNA_ID=CAMNT_0008116519 /DNA_START=78 /DNA_END=548 /DNA_ORIENTATION=+